MKKILLVTAALMLAHVAAFAQSEIVFDNNVNASGTPGEFPGTVKAPVYNVSPNAPTVRVSGNTAAGVPMGSTTYGGALLNGTGFTATLWGLNSANVTGSADLGANNLALLVNGTTTMRTSTSAANAGRFAGTGINLLSTTFDLALQIAGPSRSVSGTTRVVRSLPGPMHWQLSSEARHRSVIRTCSPFPGL